MLNSTFTIKRGDTLPRMQAILKGGDGQVINLDLASGVTFSMAVPSGPDIVVTVDIVDGPTGLVELVWSASDTAVVGVYDGDFAVTFGTDVLTVPNDRCIQINIREQC